MQPPPVTGTYPQGTALRRGEPISMSGLCKLTPSAASRKVNTFGRICVSCIQNEAQSSEVMLSLCYKYPCLYSKYNSLSSQI